MSLFDTRLPCEYVLVALIVKLQTMTDYGQFVIKFGWLRMWFNHAAFIYSNILLFLTLLSLTGVYDREMLVAQALDFDRMITSILFLLSIISCGEYHRQID